MRIDDGVKREILSRIDIGEYIGAVVTLRKVNSDLVGLCPFHGEKTPSFRVHPDRGFYKCFGCGKTGDVITFVMEHESVPFMDALRILAKRANVELEPENPAAARARSEKEAIYHANEIAAAYFHRVLMIEASGATGRAYAEKRGITREMIERFKLGYAPEGWENLVRELQRENVPMPVAQRAGLVRENQRGGYRDFYRERLMVPTYASTGETIAFGGRALGDKEPKYLNTSTTPVYTKGRFLYAMNLARRAAATADAMIVVEGYLDCIALHQAGFGNAVASLGTAFTPEQARELKKVTSNVYLCFDADGAGRSATAKSLEVLREAGCVGQVVPLPQGEDPDTYVRNRGNAAFTDLLRKAIPAVQYKLDLAIEGIRPGFDRPADVARKAEEIVHDLSPREEWDRWRVYVAGRLGVNVDDLRKSRLVYNSAHFAPRGGAGFTRHAAVTLEAPTFERDVIAIALEEPALIAEYASAITPDRFASAGLRRIYEVICANVSGLSTTGDVLALFAEDQNASATLAALGGSERSATRRFVDTDSRRELLNQVKVRLRRGDDEIRRREVDKTITELYEAGQPVPHELRDELAALTAKLKG